MCRVCGTRVDERVSTEDREVPCPDCYKPVKIPGRPAGAPAATVPTLKIEDPGVYRLDRDEPASDDGTPAKRRKRKKGPAPLLVTCPICHCRLHPPIRKESYNVRCPDCHRAVKVPDAEEAARLREQRRRLEPKLEPIEPIPFAVSDDLPPRVLTHFTLQGVQIREEPIPEPPRWVWFSDIFTFPWQRDVLRRWVYTSVGLSAFGGLMYLVVFLLLREESIGIVLMGFLMMPAIWIGMVTASYVASGWITVITDTAAGSRRIAEWPNVSWREGIFPFMAIAFQGVVAALFGHGAGLLSLAAGGPYGIVFDTVVLLLFPFLALSMMETNTWYWPFSKPVTQSLWQNFRDWVMCYLLLAVVLGGVHFVWTIVHNHWPIVALAPSGMIWAAQILISGRLLGRLGWRISHDG